MKRSSPQPKCRKQSHKFVNLYARMRLRLYVYISSYCSSLLLRTVVYIRCVYKSSSGQTIGYVPCQIGCVRKSCVYRLLFLNRRFQNKSIDIPHRCMRLLGVTSYDINIFISAVSIERRKVHLGNHIYVMHPVNCESVKCTFMY